MRRFPRWAARAAWIVAFLTLSLACAVFIAGDRLSAPATRAIAQPPAELQAEAVRFQTSIGDAVAGWWAPGRPEQAAVLLLHGVRGDRRQMLARAQFLQRLGYSSLLIDLPAHGESGGERITFGWRESHAVTAAMQWLRLRHPGRPLGVIGVSLGAASTVLARLEPAPQAVVLESMYPSIAEAVSDRLSLHLGPLGPVLGPVLLTQLPLRLGVSAEQLRPIDHLTQFSARGTPLLIASGTEDRHTTAEETRRLFAAAGEPKELWLVDGAAHVDLHAFAPAAYEARIGAFLARTLAAR